jgi:tRNA threonylcarbamoyladenosine biosynthesis protein TsaE
MSVERRTDSVEATEALGESLAAHLRPGDVVALRGPLGAGKTRFVAGLARGAGAASRVRSPSFTLLHEYRGRVSLAHLDLYRLEGAEAEGLGLDEWLDRAVLVVEWGEKLPRRFLTEALEIVFEPVGESERRITASAEAGRGVELLAAWRELQPSR